MGSLQGVTGYWVRHEHIGCDRMYVTMAPNVRKCIGDAAPGMVMVTYMRSQPMCS